jgi:hypothetical protein
MQQNVTDFGQFSDMKYAVLLISGSTFVDQSPPRERPLTVAHSMHQRFGGPIAIALERSKGPIVYALQTYQFFKLFPLNPSMRAKH